MNSPVKRAAVLPSAMHQGQRGPSISWAVEKVAVVTQPLARPQQARARVDARTDPVATGSG